MRSKRGSKQETPQKPIQFRFVTRRNVAKALSSHARATLRRRMKELGNALLDETESGAIVVVFTDNEESERLNSTYRKKFKPTDVLSFSGIEPGHLGDLLIAIPVAKRQAKEYGVTLIDELTRLLVHGTLHLLGYEHEKVKPAVARKMRRREEELLGRLL